MHECQQCATWSDWYMVFAPGLETFNCLAAHERVMYFYHYICSFLRPERSRQHRGLKWNGNGRRFRTWRIENALSVATSGLCWLKEIALNERDSMIAGAEESSTSPEGIYKYDVSALEKTANAAVHICPRIGQKESRNFSVGFRRRFWDWWQTVLDSLHTVTANTEKFSHEKFVCFRIIKVNRSFGANIFLIWHLFRVFFLISEKKDI